MCGIWKIGEGMGFVANWQQNRLKQNFSFDAPIMLNVIAQFDRKSKEQISRNRVKFAEGSKWAKMVKS